MAGFSIILAEKTPGLEGGLSSALKTALNLTDAVAGQIVGLVPVILFGDLKRKQAMAIPILIMRCLLGGRSNRRMVTPSQSQKICATTQTLLKINSLIRISAAGFSGRNAKLAKMAVLTA